MGFRLLAQWHTSLSLSLSLFLSGTVAHLYQTEGQARHCFKIFLHDLLEARCKVLPIVCVRVCVRVHACVRACVHACVYVFVCVCRCALAVVRREKCWKQQEMLEAAALQAAMPFAPSSPPQTTPGPAGGRPQRHGQRIGSAVRRLVGAESVG